MIGPVRSDLPPRLDKSPNLIESASGTQDKNKDPQTGQPWT